MKIGRKPKTDAAPAGKKLNYDLLSKTLRSFIRDAALIKEEPPLAVKIFENKIEGQIGHYPPDILDRLNSDGLLKPVLEKCLTARIIALAERTDHHQSELVLKILADRAGRGDMKAVMTLAYKVERGNLEAAILLEDTAHGWDKEYVESLAGKELLAPILKTLSSPAVVDLAKKIELSYKQEDLSGPRDQIIGRLLELAQRGHKTAVDYLVAESNQWDPAYKEHLAKFSVLDGIEKIYALRVFSNLREAVLAVTGENNIVSISNSFDTLSLDYRQRP